MKVKSLSRVRLLATPRTAAHQAPPSMGFSRQEFWSGVPLPSPAAPREKPNVLDDTTNIQPKTGMPPKLLLCHLFRPPPRVCVKGICPGGALPGLNKHTHTTITTNTPDIHSEGIGARCMELQPPQLERSTGFKEIGTLSLALQQGDSLERTSNVE